MSFPADVVLAIFTWLLFGAATLWFMAQMRILNDRAEPLDRNMSLLVIMGGALSAIIAVCTLIARACLAEASFALDNRFPKP